MPGFLANRGLLATAWFVILGALAGGLALILLQPPPPPLLGKPVVVALNLPPPADSGEDLPLTAPDPGAETAVATIEPDAAGKEQSPEEPAIAAPVPPVTPEARPATPPQAQPETPVEKHSEAPGSEAVTAEQPAAATAVLPIPQPVAAPEPEAASSDPAPSEAALPQAAAAESAPAAQGEAGHEKPAPAAAPAAPPPVVTATLALPEPKPESPPKGAASGPDAPQDPAAPAGLHASEMAEPVQEQVATIPVIPPAPEELPYWERYRQPFNMDDKRPRIAVVLSGLGLSDSATEAAINKLPPAVTLSFSPYARGLERWIALARARGHEVMLDLPMEPATFPNEDPGPQGLLVNLSVEDNLDRLDWVLSRGSAYVGLAGAMGSRFTASRRSMKPILEDVKQRGLMFLDRRTTEHSVVPEIAHEIGLPRAINNRSVDERQASRVAIDARLAQIERIALSEGFAVAMAQPYPVTLDRLAEWATELIGRGFVIAPISALADQQKTP